MKFAYIRTSTKDQKASLAEQERRLREAGATEVYIEERSGKSAKNRPELQAMLNKVREGDTVLCTKLDRLCRSTKDFMDIFELIEERGASLEFTDQPIDCTSPAGRMMLGMLSVFASFERELIQERVQAGVGKARRDGKRLGRPPVDHSNNPKVQAIRTLVESGQSVSAAARAVGVSRPTAYRWLAA